MSADQNTNPPSTGPFETNRLAVSLLEAAAGSDEHQAAAVLAEVERTGDGDGLLLALVDMVSHALESQPAPLEVWATAYRRLLDQAEAMVTGPDRGEGR